MNFIFHNLLAQVFKSLFALKNSMYSNKQLSLTSIL